MAPDRLCVNANGGQPHSDCHGGGKEQFIIALRQTCLAGQRCNHAREVGAEAKLASVSRDRVRSMSVSNSGALSPTMRALRMAL